MALRIGQHVKFKDNQQFSGVIFEFQDEGMVAGLKEVSEKLKAQGADETHEPVDNLEASSSLAVGDTVFMLSDGKEFYGTVFEFQDEGMVAGLKDLSAKIKGLGCGDETHEPVENLQVLRD